MEQKYSALQLLTQVNHQTYVRACLTAFGINSMRIDIHPRSVSIGRLPKGDDLKIYSTFGSTKDLLKISINEHIN